MMRVVGVVRTSKQKGHVVVGLVYSFVMTSAGLPSSLLRTAKKEKARDGDEKKIFSV